MGTLFVNKSGRAFKITRTNGGSDVIGTLPVNAIFAWTDSWAGNGAGADYQGFIATVCMVGLMELLVPEHLHL